MILELINKPYIDAAEMGQFDIQEAANSLIEGLINLHDDIIFLLIFLFCFLVIFLINIIYFFTGIKSINYFNSNIINFKDINLLYKSLSFNTRTNVLYMNPSHNTLLEFIWTLLPSLILITLILPTLALLYSFDDIYDAVISIKVIGNQWYWTYEYGEIKEAK